MIAIVRAVAMLAILATAAGCSFGTHKPATYDYTPYVANNPRSVLVAPMMAQSEHARHYLATIAQPLAERGYYVMPIRLTQDLLVEEGYQERARELWIAWRPEEGGSHWDLVDETKHPGVREMAIELAGLSSADSVLFVFIEEWRHQVDSSEGYFSNWVDAKMNHYIDLDYLLIGAEGDTLWRARKRVEYTRGGGGFFSEIWNAKHKASDEEIDTAIARDVNRLMIEARRTKNEMTGSWFPGYPMLVGPYHPAYEADRTRRQPGGQ